MSCCGRGRLRVAAPLRRSAPASRAGTATPPAALPETERRGVLFEYLGATALTVRGARTGRSYRFASEGAVVAVDPRDAPSVERVPVLRRLR